MEESVIWQFDQYLAELFDLKDVNIQDYSPLALAYIGDCVYDLIVKTMVFHEGNKQVKKMHQETSYFVQASAQSKIMRILQEELTEEERGVYKRGRNTKSVSPAKNQSVTDYRRATGFESLIGYLYLKKEYKRLLTLVKMGIDVLKPESAEEVNE